MSAAERHQFLVEWNVTDRGPDPVRGLHEPVAEGARQHPDAVALAFAGQRLSYGELDRRANRLARYLFENVPTVAQPGREPKEGTPAHPSCH